MLSVLYRHYCQTDISLPRATAAVPVCAMTSLVIPVEVEPERADLNLGGCTRKGADLA
jgi:hypothetical protein